MPDFLTKAISAKLTVAASALTDQLISKYLSEFENTLSRIATNIANNVASNLVIEDNGDTLTVTLANPDAMKSQS